MVLLSYIGESLRVPFYLNMSNDSHPLVLKSHDEAVMDLLSRCKMGGVSVDFAMKRILVIGYSFSLVTVLKEKQKHLKLFAFYVSYSGQIMYWKEIWVYKCILLTTVMASNHYRKNTISQISVLKSDNCWYLHFGLCNDSNQFLIYNNTISIQLNCSDLSIMTLALNESEICSVVDCNIADHSIELGCDNNDPLHHKNTFYLQDMCHQSPFYTFFHKINIFYHFYLFFFCCWGDLF
ncbi:hypothetical protein RFI_03562 [Reticulomyxa filosa]|uniref:Uncharacterized protein n=1 Tax=Reticulomyxa filosa TaxID=46433 RepID=X6P623_RETFI|nr:hypothetical protein RFI_03562 [Reticulomyxa filosa]|eukprot:ETO33539.1 hypothetical protein RFI_03562 [Reticulomyxa filosa]